MTDILILAQSLVNVTRRKLVQLLVVPEYYDSDVDRAKHGQLVRLLEKTAFAFQESARHTVSSVFKPGKT